MENEKIVIAGFGSAGYAALVTIKRINPKANIIVVDPKEKDIVHPCGLPYALEGIVKKDHLKQDIFLKRMNVEKIKGIITKIDKEKRMIIVQSNEEQQIPFSKAIVCTGYKPFIPPINGIKEHLHKTVFTLSSIHDLQLIEAKLASAKNAVVIGAGAIGLEVAHALAQNGLNVTVFEAQSQVLPNAIDHDMTEPVVTHLTEDGIEIHCNTVVSEIAGDTALQGIIADNEEYPADIIIVATGFKPNCEWATNSLLPCANAGVQVNKNLETEIAGVFAAGDCIQSWSAIDGKPVFIKLATSAYKQGIIAAENVLGKSTEYRGTTGTFVTKIGKLEIAATGFSTNVAKERGFSVIAGKIGATVKPEYFPNDERLTFKVVCDTNGKIIGAQAIGNGASSRINVVSLAIECGLTIDDLMRFEMAYCPAVSEVNDIVFKACEFAKRRMK